MKSAIVIAGGLGILLSITILVLSIYALTISTQFSIPIPAIVSTLSLLVPVLGPGALSFQLRSLSRKKPSLRLSQSIFLISIIFDTILLTYSVSSLNYSFLNCQLQRQWYTLHSQKNSAFIRGIQDKMDCCGFRSLVDKAWPFESKHEQIGPDACKKAFPARRRPCMMGLIGEEKKILGMMIAVGLVSLLSKLIFLLFLYSPNRNWFIQTRGNGSYQNVPDRYTDSEGNDRLPSFHRQERQAEPRDGTGERMAAPQRQITDRSYIDNDEEHVDATERDGTLRPQRQLHEGEEQASLISLERE